MSEDRTREEHLAWAKERALEYLPERPDLAIASFTSDLSKHSGTAGRQIEAGVDLNSIATAYRLDDIPGAVRGYIEEFA